MGNNTSNSSSGGPSHNLKGRISAKFHGGTGSLGLSKKELDRLCQPSGLYESWPWDDKAIRKLIGDGKLAPRLKGCDRREVVKQEECPICFLHYGQMNKTGCCKAYVCTECYLQVRPQKLQTGNNNSDVGCCPFCNTPKFTTTLANLTDEGGMKRDLEEKKTLEAQMRARANSEATVSSNGDCLDSPHVTDSTIISEEKQDEDCENRDPVSPKIMPSETIGIDSDQFGASLSRDLARRRTLSNASDSSPLKSQNKESEIVIVASVEERKQLEEDMKKQIYHPLARQVAEETSVASASLPQGSRGRGSLDSFVQKGTIEEKIGSPLENIANDVAKEMNDSENLVMSVPRVAERDTEAIGKTETRATEVVDSIVRVEKALQATPSESRALTFFEVFEVVTQAEAIFKFDEKVLEDFVQNIGTDAAVEDIVVVKLQAADNNMESIVKAAEEVAQNSEERAMNHVNSDTSLESCERVEVDTSIVDKAYPIEAKKVVDAGHERTIAVLSTQQEVATDTRKSLEKNTEEMNSVQESNRKPIESASSEPSYPTDDKNKSRVDTFKRKRRYPEAIHRRIECSESLNAVGKIAKEVINRKIEASVGSAARAYETAIIDLVYRDLKAVSENMFEGTSQSRVIHGGNITAGFEPITF